MREENEVFSAMEWCLFRFPVLRQPLKCAAHISTWVRGWKLRLIFKDGLKHCHRRWVQLKPGSISEVCPVRQQQAASCGGFLSHGGTPSSHPLKNRIFHYKPSSYCGTTIYGTPHVSSQVARYGKYKGQRGVASWPLLELSLTCPQRSCPFPAEST